MLPRRVYLLNDVLDFSLSTEEEVETIDGLVRCECISHSRLQNALLTL